MCEMQLLTSHLLKFWLHLLWHTIPAEARGCLAADKDSCEISWIKGTCTAHCDIRAKATGMSSHPPAGSSRSRLQHHSIHNKNVNLAKHQQPGQCTPTLQRDAPTSPYQQDAMNMF
jgi:hypothetical protein